MRAPRARVEFHFAADHVVSFEINEAAAKMYTDQFADYVAGKNGLATVSDGKTTCRINLAHVRLVKVQSME